MGKTFTNAGRAALARLLPVPAGREGAQRVRRRKGLRGGGGGACFRVLRHLHESSPGEGSWVVPFSSLSLFGPRRMTRIAVAGGVVPRPPRARRRASAPETTATPSSCHARVHALRERVDARPTPPRRHRRDRQSHSTQEDEPEPIKPEPKKGRKRKKREDQPPPRRKFRVKALEAARPSTRRTRASTSRTRA